MSVEAAAVKSSLRERHDTIGRHVYVFTAVLFIVVAIAGFAPRSIRILSGTLPTPPVIVHVHAALMSAWLLLVLAQASLIAVGRRAVHQTLGLASFVLAPAVLIAMVLLVFIGYRDSIGTPLQSFRANVVLLQLGPVLLFPLFYVLAVRARRTDLETHKRFMLMATMVLFPAAIARLVWLPGYVLLVNNYIVLFYEMLLLAPAVVYDVVRFGRPHRAYVIGFAVFAPFVAAALALWDSPAWHRVVAALLG
jgi:hypothetical protein